MKTVIATLVTSSVAPDQNTLNQIKSGYMFVCCCCFSLIDYSECLIWNKNKYWYIPSEMLVYVTYMLTTLCTKQVFSLTYFFVSEPKTHKLQESE